MAYKKDVAPNEGGDENQDDDSKSDKHGNLGLPFGLCAKYGIPLPENATPRMAWNALKEHNGMYPPWTEKGEGQYPDDDGKSGDKNADEARQQSAIEVGKKLRQKLKGRFPKDYQEALENALENLDDNEVAAFSATIDDLAEIRNGSGCFYSGFRRIHIPAKDSPTPYDKAMGYTFPAQIFFHEYGHFLGYELWKKQGGFGGAISFHHDFTTAIPGLSQAVNDDVKDFIGDGKDVWDKLAAICDKEKYNLYKPEPINAEQEYKEVYDRYKSFGYSDDQAKAKAEYYVGLSQRIYDERLTKWNKYSEEEINRGKENFRRMSFLSDTISIATGGRYDAYQHGFSGHSAKYSRSTPNGVEAWAEFVAIKMLKDSQGEKAFKKYLPRTYKIFNEQYAKMGDMLK